ncbi:MAG: hypothetical protein R2877_08190 [Bdellovibrionota bacterium]
MKKFKEQGVHAVEIKTGYGLTHDEEIRHLKILQQIKKKHASDHKIRIMYMGLTLWPKALTSLNT